MSSVSEIIKTYKPNLTKYEDIYKYLHKYPGLSLQETLAAVTAANHLLTLPGIKVKSGIGGNGVIGILENGPGATILLRADTDALPIKELTGLPYASTATQIDIADGVEKPVMHACGHDMHVACMLAASTTLHKAQEHWSGTIIFLFQPNEERGAGAQVMVDDGLYDPDRHACPWPDFVLGQHVMPYPAGTIGTRQGNFTTAADSFEVTIYGRGGHASQPHNTVDPIVMAAHIIVRLQTIVSREVDPKDSSVVTVGSVQAGMTENIIPDSATLKINVRTAREVTRTRVLAAIRRIVKAECDASGASAEPKWVSISSFPCTINDEQTTANLEDAFGSYFGADQYNSSVEPLYGSEDFSTLAREAPRPDGGKGVPSSYWVFGGTDAAEWKRAQQQGRLLEDIPINHSAHFAPAVRPTLRTGHDGLVVAALHFLQ